MELGERSTILSFEILLVQPLQTRSNGSKGCIDRGNMVSKLLDLGQELPGCLGLLFLG